MLRNLVGLAIVLGLATCVVMPILAQEEAGEAVPAPAEPAITAEPEVPVDAEGEYSYGTVISIAGDQLVVSEYDYEKDEEVNVTYTIDPKVQLRNIKELKEVVAGDSIDISYTLKDGKKVATLISVEKLTEEEPAVAMEEVPADTESE